MTDSSNKTDHRADFNILSGQISDIVDSLPEKRKRIFQLSREKGLTHQEISNQLGILVKTVENQINLALKQIKKHPLHLGGTLFIPKFDWEKSGYR